MQVTSVLEVLWSMMICLMVNPLAFTSSRISISMPPSALDDVPSHFAQVSCFVMCENWLSCLIKHHIECQRNCLMVLLFQVKPIIQDNPTKLLSTWDYFLAQLFTSHFSCILNILPSHPMFMFRIASNIIGMSIIPNMAWCST